MPNAYSRYLIGPDAHQALQRFLATLLFLMAIGPLPLWAAASDGTDSEVSGIAAHVIASRGQVVATDPAGAERMLKRRSAVYVGETLHTGPNARLQLRFTDNALMTLQADTRFRIDSYEAGSPDSGGKALMELVQGGFRTITGTIGKGQGDAYRVDSKAASIGIRGTHYEAVQSGEALVVGVYAGGVTVANDQGQIPLGSDAAFRFSRVASGQPPQGLQEAPEELGVAPPDVSTDEQSTPDEEAPAEEEGSAEEAGAQSAEESTSSGQETAQQAETGNEDSGASTEGQSNEAVDDSGAEAVAGTTDSPAGDGPVEGPGVGGFSGAQEETMAGAELVAEPDSTTTTPLDGGTDVTDNPVVDQVAVDFTETNDELGTVLEEGATHTTDPSAPSAVDGRLSNEEYDQLQTAPLAALVTHREMPVFFIATLIAPTAPQPFDFTADPARFTLEWTDASSTTSTAIQVILTSNITTINDLVADINDDLTANSSPVLVRESQTATGQLEFYTVPLDATVEFFLHNYQGDTANVDALQIENTLGGLLEGSFAQGGLEGVTPQPLYAVKVGAEPVFIGGDDPDPPSGGATGGSTGGAGNTPGAFVEEAMFNDADLNDPTTYIVGRIGDASQSDVDPAVGGRNNIQWGIWNASAANPINLYKDSTNPSSFEAEEDGVYWITAEAAALSSLVGTASFATTGDVLGSGSDGSVTGISGSFDVNFGNGDITNGVLNLTTANQSWQSQFDGKYQDAQALMKVYDGSITGTGFPSCTSCVAGRMGGVFVDPGDAFAGGFSLFRTDDPATYVQGVMLMEKQ